MQLNMKSIIVTYPGFQSLPRGVKQMLVASENMFFGDARPTISNARNQKHGGSLQSVFFGNPRPATKFRDAWAN